MSNDDDDDDGGNGASERQSGGRPPRTNWPHDVPGPAELVDAVQEFLMDDAAPRSQTRDRWMSRIAANALAIAKREMESGSADALAHAERLAQLGVATEDEFAQVIRAGELDDRRAELAGHLWATTLDKLAVANPGYRDETLES